MTPWHSAIVVGIDGSFRTVHAADVRDTHDLIFKNGLPHHFREKSDLWDLANIKVDFEHLYPCGLVIRPAPELTVQPSIREVDGAKFRKLAEANSPVILRGFAETTERNLFVGKAHEIGKVLHTVPWTPKVVQEVKDSKKFDKGSNNVTSSEAMPMHYDGVFKFVNKKDRYGNDVKDEQGDDVKVPNPPA